MKLYKYEISYSVQDRLKDRPAVMFVIFLICPPHKKYLPSALKWH